MDDPLHLYPTLASLLWLWGVGVFAQVVAQMGWWMLLQSRLSTLIPLSPRSRAASRVLGGRSTLFLRRFLAICWHGKKRHEHASKHQEEPPCEGDVVAGGSDLPLAHSRVAPHHDHVIIKYQIDRLLPTPPAIQEQYGVYSRPRVNRSAGRSFHWKRLAVRSALLTMLVAITSTVTSTIMLYMRTGRYVQQPYDWYSLAATGDRFFSDHLSLPSHLQDTCKFRNASGAQTDMKTLDQVISKYQRASGALPRQHTHVYVVPFFWDHVVELRLDQVQPVVSSTSSSLSSSSASAGDPSKVVSYEKARPVDEVSMFPYLWHNILGPHFDKRVIASSSRDESPWSRSVEALNLEFEIVRSSEQLAALPHGSNLLVVSPSIYIIGSLFDMKPTLLPPDANVGFLSLAREDCNNLEPDKYLNNPQLKFGFLPYGDCSLVDADRFDIVPLGPSFEHGFPTNAHLVESPPLSAKKYLLNLMVSWTVEKPTRIQAAMAALEVCSIKERTSNTKLCIVEHNDMMFKALQFVDDHAGTNLRWMLSSAPDAYITNVKQSIFTLCPLGKNPEQYRIWEALAAGSIPIIEELPAAQSLPGTFYHPSYPMSWKCMPEDMHGILKRLDAPVLFVSDWKRGLPRIMDEYIVSDTENPSTFVPTSKLLELYAHVKPWYKKLGTHLQAQVIAKTMDKFGPSTT